MRAGLILLSGLLFVGCTRAAPPPAASAPPKNPSAPDNPSRSAPIEAPRTVMKPLAKDDSDRKAPAPRNDLSVPSSGETPRYPRDYGIGPLGPGKDDDAYRTALGVLADAAAGKPTAGRFTEAGARSAAALAQTLSALGASPSFRAGSPAPLEGGGVSFLVRAFGAAGSASGEMNLRAGTDGRWLVDSASLEADPKNDRSAEPEFDPLSYKRFL